MIVAVLIPGGESFIRNGRLETKHVLAILINVFDDWFKSEAVERLRFWLRVFFVSRLTIARKIQIWTFFKSELKAVDLLHFKIN